MKIKICGLRRIEDVEYANEARPDYIGFILTPGYKRSITKETAWDLKKKLSPDIRAVGVFVNEDPTVIAGYLKEGIIDMAQLHGSESDEDILRIRDLTGKSLIKMVKAERREDIERAFSLEADYILFDSGAGTGMTFDRSELKTYLEEQGYFKDPGLFKRFFIAGGITSENIREVYEDIKPFGVDISGGVETDGVKDSEKMKKAVEMSRQL